MGTCRICDSEMGRARGRRVAVGNRSSRRVCDDCVSMLTPPEELGGAPASDSARADAAASPSSLEWGRSTVRAATTTTTVALAPRAWGLPATRAVALALTALALAAATAWLLLSSGMS